MLWRKLIVGVVAALPAVVWVLALGFTSGWWVIPVLLGAFAALCIFGLAWMLMLMRLEQWAGGVQKQRRRRRE